MEECFDQSPEAMRFHASNLLPGNSYMLRVVSEPTICPKVAATKDKTWMNHCFCSHALLRLTFIFHSSVNSYTFFISQFLF